MKDILTPKQRASAFKNGGIPDRLPCVPIIGNTAARVIGVKVSELRNNAKLLAEAHIASYRRFGYDGVRIFSDLYVQAEAMGANVTVPEDETAYLGNPAIRSVSEIDKLRPADPYKDGVLPQQIEAMKIAVDAIGEEVSVSGALTCPFTNASFLIGSEQLVRLMLKNPGFVHKLCRISLESNLAYADAVFNAGSVPSLTDAMSSSTVISPSQFREFSLPYLKTLVEYIHSRGAGVTLHICGKTHPIWKDMADSGADCLSIDNAASLSDAKMIVGDRVRLMGNIPPSEVILQGSTEEVRQAVKKCLIEAGDNPKGYTVASGCSLPTETPFANIDAMLDAVRTAGWPIDIDKL